MTCDKEIKACANETQVPSGGTVAAAPAAGGAPAAAAAAEEKEEKKEEEKVSATGSRGPAADVVRQEESDEDMGFGLFD